MFIVMLTYIQPLSAVERLIDEHISFLDKYYSSGHFICSGRRNPRIGGVIICKARDSSEVDSIIAEDPFYVHGVAEYEVTEFIPTKYAEGLEKFIK